MRLDVIAMFCLQMKLGQCLFTLKNLHLQAGKNEIDANISVFVKINHSSNMPIQGPTLIFLAARQSGLLLPDAAGPDQISLVLTNCLYQRLGNALLHGFL